MARVSSLACAFGGLPWMQAVFYGVGAAVIGIIAISAYKLTCKTIKADKLLWLISQRRGNDRYGERDHLAERESI